jgi:uncharacterized protein with ParB-like and HNH nuclease domain
MNANAVSFLNIFEKKLRLEVPLFQRQYVWKLEQQWEPLWEDICRKFTDCLDHRDAPVHFLGAMVLDQKQTPTTHVERRQVIDGQQRLITLQIFLSAFRDFCNKVNSVDLATECDGFVQNRGMMPDPSVDRFKVWPTQLDRDQYANVVTLGSEDAVIDKYPRTYRKYARHPEPRPRMVEAYLYFYGQLTSFFLGSDSEPPLANEQALASRLEQCFQALRDALRVVVIDLDKDDDAQVIFETLNARGEPLLPADLLRNFIFLRAARQGEPQEELYNTYWRKFDDPFWRTEIKQGRLLRPRSDLFMQHFLASRQATDIPVKHLFAEYKYWIDKKHPFQAVREELATLSRQGDNFRRMIEPKKDDVLYALATFLDCYDISTVHPLLLCLFDLGISESDFSALSVVIESYLIRRAVCGMTTKNYNRVFFGLIRSVRETGSPIDKVRNYLSGLSGESSEWPTDAQFAQAWQNNHVYQTLGNNSRRIVHILQRINNTYLSNKNERIIIDNPLTIEHILPQNWVDNWPLPDGSKGLKGTELWAVDSEDPVAKATRYRDQMLNTMGNLTIVTQSANSGASNLGWADKKPQLLVSLLPINQILNSYQVWDENMIQRRGEETFKRAISIWPAPPKVAAS